MATGMPVIFIAQVGQNGKHRVIIAEDGGAGAVLHVTDGTAATEDEAFEAAFAWCKAHGFDAERAKRTLANYRRIGKQVHII